ncbi:MAG: Tagatose-6-phosphate kinase [Planctomycetes bacterium ADurb.Bin401]|nr:MAG: Tagatose-6-phosphate kinase [Planctomycetes bacterium ADurb.Bin401]
MKKQIITIGLTPAWDRTIEIDGIDWNEHKIISSQRIVPAGKALNINKSLAWMGVKSTAAGLWGSHDFEQMKKTIAGADLCVCPKRANTQVRPYINIQMTKAVGRTRENITVVDTKNKRQIHLRDKSTLANQKSLKLLKQDLGKIISKDSLCVFAGAAPIETVELLELAKKKGSLVIVDTSGPALKKIVSKGGLFLIKPNVEELGELVGKKIRNEEKEIIFASKKLLTKSKLILVSRGEKGAMLLFRSEPRASATGTVVAISAKYTGKKYPVCNTVACGDYLLAGFLSVIARSKATRQSQPAELLCADALETAIKSATAKAFGINEDFSWLKVKNIMKIRLSSAYEI